MILDIDIGNSATKWRLSEFCQILDSGIDQRDASEGLGYTMDVKPVKMARVSSVLNATCTARELEKFELGEEVPVHYAKVISPFKGFVCAYESLCQLGVDRWLAMLSAWRQASDAPFLVVDAGSAMTLDLVDNRGKHLGGYIVPGLQNQHRSLQSKTKLVNYLQAYDTNTEPGTTTDQCVNRGVLEMFRSMIAAAESYLAERCGMERTIFLTGGDREILSSLFPNAKVRENLVLDGLAVAFSYDSSLEMFE